MTKKEDSEEIDLAEILCRLWAYKFLHVSIIFISIFVSIFYIINTEKVYTASSTFIPHKPNSSDGLQNQYSSIPSGLSLLGFAGTVDKTKQFIERFTGREFILRIADKLDLRNDKFFSNYDANTSKPAWQLELKALINWNSTLPDPANKAEWTVLKNFKNHVTMKSTEAGAITLTVEHSDAKRAAEIANFIVSESISIVKSEEIKNSNDRVKYLSQLLADSLIKLGTAESNLKQFMLSNNSASVTAFYNSSVMLDELRAERANSEKQIETIDVLLTYIRGQSPTTYGYLELREKYPLLDQPDFRRILGISETISAWRWPSLKALIKAQSSIRDRAGSLEAEIRKLEIEALKNAESAEELRKLMRAVKLAEAWHKVLTEQVKSVSILAGYTPDNSQILAIANIPIIATKPQKILILIFGTIIGSFFSAVLALVLGWKKGVFHSREALVKAIDPRFEERSRFLKYYRNSNLKEAQQNLNIRPAPWLKHLFLETAGNHRPSTVIVADTTDFKYASLIARLLGSSASDFDVSVAYVDLSKNTSFEEGNVGTQGSQTKDDINAIEHIKGCTEYDYIGGKQNVDWLFSKSFQDTLASLNRKYDVVLFSAELNTLNILYSSGLIKNSKLLIFAAKGKTKSREIHKLANQGSIEIALLW